MSDRRILYTIGYAPFGPERFVEVLLQHGIEVVCDVRSAPYSKYRPEFNKKELQARLEQNGIKYLFLGRELGARREEAEAYTDGKVDYEKTARLEQFRSGLERLRTGIQKYRVALVCAEKDPIGCHRTILVCRNLRGEGIEIRHILESGKTESHHEAESRLLMLHGFVQNELFESPEDLIERAYRRQAETIAFSEETDGKEADSLLEGEAP